MIKIGFDNYNHNRISLEDCERANKRAGRKKLVAEREIAEKTPDRR